MSPRKSTDESEPSIRNQTPPPRHDSDEDELYDGFESFCDSLPSNPGFGFHPKGRPSRVFFDRERDQIHVGNRRTLVGLEWKEPYWVGEADLPFRPEGLFVVKAPAGALLKAWFVGNERILPAGPTPVSLSTFNAIEQGPYESVRPHFSTCGPAVAMRLSVTSAAGEPLSPADFDATVWGIVARYL